MRAPHEMSARLHLMSGFPLEGDLCGAKRQTRFIWTFRPSQQNGLSPLNQRLIAAISTFITDAVSPTSTNYKHPSGHLIFLQNPHSLLPANGQIPSRISTFATATPHSQSFLHLFKQKYFQRLCVPATAHFHPTFISLKINFIVILFCHHYRYQASSITETFFRHTSSRDTHTQ